LEISESIRNKFIELYHSSEDITVMAPGRINLLGEHTDYNEGLVLPSAINKGIYFCVNKRADNKLIINAFDLNETVECDNINQLNITSKHWSSHLIGVILEIQKLNKILPTGLNVCFGGDIPLGAGLSSSAAIEAGFAFVLNELFKLNLSLLAITKIAQYTEHNYIGVKCGIMDMYASVFSKKNHVLKLDCRTLNHEFIPAIMPDHTFVLVNSGVKHNLAESAYNTRRQQCADGVEVLNKKYPHIHSLRDATLSDLESVKLDLSHEIYNKCKYVIAENTRVETAAIHLTNSNLAAFGKIMFETHEGLKDLYEVSCAEIDFLVDIVKNKNEVLGARMMGGGFGGCTLNLVKNSFLVDFKKNIIEKYNNKFGITPQIYDAELRQGVDIV
jgi:galactokinase